MSPKIAEPKVEIKLTLPDSVAREAKEGGLLESASLELLLREELRRRRIDRLFEAADRLAHGSESTLTRQEVEEEIRAVRSRRADHASRR